MNEDGVALLFLPEDVSRAFGSVFDGMARSRAGADSWCDHCWCDHCWCDHCWRGDHLPCDLWGRGGCRCPHHDEGSNG